MFDPNGIEHAGQLPIFLSAKTSRLFENASSMVNYEHCSGSIDCRGVLPYRTVDASKYAFALHVNLVRRRTPYATFMEASDSSNANDFYSLFVKIGHLHMHGPFST